MIRLLANFCKIKDLSFLSPEICSEDPDTVADNLSVGHLDISAATVAPGENIHTHGYERTIVHLHCQHLIVDNIIITMINATPVITLFKFLRYDLFNRLAGRNVEIIDPLPTAPIEIDCRIGTRLLD